MSLEGWVYSLSNLLGNEVNYKSSHRFFFSIPCAHDSSFLKTINGKFLRFQVCKRMVQNIIVYSLILLALLQWGFSYYYFLFFVFYFFPFLFTQLSYKIKEFFIYCRHIWYILFWYYNIIIHFSLIFSPSRHSNLFYSVLFKPIAFSFLIVITDIYFIYIYIPKHINTTCSICMMNVLRTTWYWISKWCALPWGRLFFPPSAFLSCL